MIKKLLIAIIFLFCTTLLACTSHHNINLEDFDKTLNEEIDLTTLNKGSSKELKRFFGLMADDFNSFLLYTPANTMDVNELLILELTDTSNVNNLKDIIENRIDSQIELFGSYGPAQCAMLEDYVLKTKGKYIFYCVSDNNDKIYDLFKQKLKAGDA